MAPPIVVRRALGSPRDVALAGQGLRDAGIQPGASLAAALAADSWGLVLVALRAGQPAGVATLRLLRAPGEAPDGPVALALVDGLHGDDEAREALLGAARAEAEGREAARFAVLDAAPPPAAPVASPAPSAGLTLTLAPGVTATLDPRAEPPAASTLWSGATAFRTRWRRDRSGLGWTVPGCVGCADDDGDALRFDAAARTLRETYLGRPARHLRDDELLARAVAAPLAPGALRLDGEPSFTLAAMDVALFDVTLAHYVALREGAGGGELLAVAASPELHLLFAAGAYVGWRVRDPVAHARPMGWPEARDAPPLDADAATTLRALLYDWMAIDASPRIDPAAAGSPEEVEHMAALRDRARALAEGDDAVAGVARDVAAHAHWGWGFFRLGP